MDKSKLLVLKVDKLFLVIPLTLTKVETRLRNVLINGKPKFDGLSRFMQFYLQTFVSSNPDASQSEHPQGSQPPIKIERGNTMKVVTGPGGQALTKVAHAV